ncbi:hypothetical protein, conserved [Leishmania tarentolae]|uniref:Uncharacterized protein n=1 Tax=Leishmania tarentolae TaxID=5689 RepID=A0A640KG08_LEITA|nr:hypothetical protein, conserved [Leishmania tarentolae]
MTSLTGATGTEAAVAPFSEENAIVLDKWLFDVCGVDDLQFPSHRRAEFAGYVERLPRVAKMKRFVANTFDYPSRSGTREILVLQKMLEALALHTQAVVRETEQLQSNVLHVRHVLEERTMGASAVAEEEKTRCANETAEEQKDNEAVAEDGDASASQQPSSVVAQATRGTEYEKKKALSLRYISTIQTKTQNMSRQRMEMERRHARLLADKEQLDKEYEALHTTEELVVARHQEAESRKNEEILLLSEENTMYAAEEAAFDTEWAMCAAMSDEEPAAECSTGDPAGRGEGLPLTSPGPRVPSPVSSSHPGSASSHPPSASVASGHSLDGEDSVDIAATAPPNTASPTVSAPNQRDDAGDHLGALSCQSPRDPPGSTASLSPAPALQRQTLGLLRHRFSEIGARITKYRRRLLSERHMHLQRFLQSQQRLKDWQGVTAGLRRTHHQLHGQVDVLRTVLSDTASRLEKGDASAQRTGYGEQLTRLNALLKDRSYETLQYYVGSRDDASMDTLLDASADEKLRKLQRPSPTNVLRSEDVTPTRDSSASASDLVTPTRQSTAAVAFHSGGKALLPSASSRTPVREAASNGTTAAATPSSGAIARSSVDLPNRHRSRYELVRHLQRWESALLAERLAILKAAHMTPGPHSGTETNTKQAGDFSASRAYEELCVLLLQQQSDAASSS